MSDATTFPAWCPAWLKKLVDEPNCSCGTHPELRRIAKWLVIYMPPDECEGLAFKWLRVAADKCDRVSDDAELHRLLTWACAKTGNQDDGSAGNYSPSQPAIDIDYLYELIVAGPTLGEFRESSRERLYDTKERNTPRILDAWAHYCGDLNPWVCYGADDYFFTRRLVDMRDRAQIFAQVVPSPMRAQYGLTVDGRASQHTLDGTRPRLFLVIEFDFVAVKKKREPTIWATLIKACAEKGKGVLDMNAALSAHLRELGPLWLVVYSGGKSLQSWFPCRDTDEETLRDWYQGEALTIGACKSTWCRSQFVRMFDGSRDDGRRQSIEYINPEVLPLPAKQNGAAYNDGAVFTDPMPLTGTNLYEDYCKQYHRNGIWQQRTGNWRF
jgi:hypothetical protein